MIATRDKAEFDRLTADIRHYGFASLAHADKMVKQGRAVKTEKGFGYEWKGNGFFGLSMIEIRIMHKTVTGANPVPGHWAYGAL